ncbi:flavodoxin family protein [candidate division WOR-3 bacterium]|nr:flavodoxin family protein [candidate division WOR-3 bacterium]
MKKIIFFNTSPRDESHSRKASEILKKLFEPEKYTAETFNFRDHVIGPCKACLECRSTGGICSQKDDMNDICEKLLRSDIFVFSFPMYMGQMNSQAKIFMDRLFAYAIRKKGKKKKQRLIMLASHGSTEKSLFKTYIKNTAKAFEYLGFEVLDAITFSGSARPVDSQPELFKKLKEISETLYD